MDEVKVFINEKELKCKRGSNLLKVALENGIYIPNLCFIEERGPYASCRLCFVEIEGEEVPRCACTVTVEEGMRVNTMSEKALRLQRTAFELIMSNHPVDCKNCGKNGVCELQRISRHLKVSLKTNRFPKLLNNLPVDETSEIFIFDPNKCVQCGKCVFLSRKMGLSNLSFAYRGFRRRVTTFLDRPIGMTECGKKEEFVRVCPVGAFAFKRKHKIEEGVDGYNR